MTPICNLFDALTNMMMYQSKDGKVVVWFRLNAFELEILLAQLEVNSFVLIRAGHRYDQRKIERIWLNLCESYPDSDLSSMLHL